MITAVAFVLVLGVLVFVHELGHFLAAKFMGVEVKSFAFGFPPTIFKRKVGETTYKINLIPLGGYVTLRGEDEALLSPKELENEQKNHRSLLSKKPWQLLVIFVSGVIMNVFLAIFLLYVCYVIGFQPIMPGMANYPGISNTQKVVVSSIEKGAPAENELTKNDVILSVDGTRVYQSMEMINIIQNKTGDGTKTVTLLINRDGQELTKTLSTYKSSVNIGNGQKREVNRIGVVLENEGKIQGNILSSLFAAVGETFRMAALTVVGLVDLFKQLISKFSVSNNVTGPVGIVVITNYLVQLGVMYMLQFTAVLSISLAVFNILPIPALDGGHILITLIEWASRRRFSSKTKNIIQYTGFALILCLLVAVTIKDLINFNIINSIKGWFVK